MGDIKLFRIDQKGVHEISDTSVDVEKSLQALFERNLERLLGVRFLASEHPTGPKHRGRIDTLGLDENNSPVIIEYKRAMNQNVINQGLFYLDWLMDHKADFRLLVQEHIGQDAAEEVEWGTPRLICIAGDFTRFDEHAVQQMGRSIELIRYRKYEEGLLLLELVNAIEGDGDEVATVSRPAGGVKGRGDYKGVADYLEQASPELKDRFGRLSAFLTSLGDDVQVKRLKFYIAFKRIKNFACMEIRPTDGKVLVYVKVDPKGMTLEPGFTRDVTDIGHYGTGDLELVIRTDEDVERALPLLKRSYESS